MNKYWSQRIHAALRAVERHNIILTDEDFKDMIDQIQSQRSEFIQKISYTRSIHRVSCQDKKVYVVYDKKRKNICTVLPDNIKKDK